MVCTYRKRSVAFTLDQVLIHYVDKCVQFGKSFWRFARMVFFTLFLFRIFYIFLLCMSYINNVLLLFILIVRVSYLEIFLFFLESWHFILLRVIIFCLVKHFSFVLLLYSSPLSSKILFWSEMLELIHFISTHSSFRYRLFWQAFIESQASSFTKLRLRIDNFSRMMYCLSSYKFGMNYMFYRFIIT